MPFLVTQASQGSGGSLLIFALPVVLIGFLFLSQRRRRRAMEVMQQALTVGDEVSTTSGLHGRIVSLDDAIAGLEVSPGVTLRFDRRALVRKPTLNTGVGGPTNSSTSAPTE